MAYAIIMTIGLMPSCYLDYICPPPVLYNLSNVNIKAIDWEEINGASTTIYTDTLRNNVGFEVTTEVEIASIQKSRLPNFGFINSAYANNCDEGIILNQIVPENSVLMVNKSFEINGFVVEANTNLLDIPVVKAWLDFPTALTYENRLKIEFDASEINIERGEYEFYFQWTTDNDVILSDMVSIYLDL